MFGSPIRSAAAVTKLTVIRSATAINDPSHRLGVLLITESVTYILESSVTCIVVQNSDPDLSPSPKV